MIDHWQTALPGVDVFKRGSIFKRKLGELPVAVPAFHFAACPHRRPGQNPDTDDWDDCVPWIGRRRPDIFE
jgi:hypothetical protein